MAVGELDLDLIRAPDDRPEDVRREALGPRAAQPGDRHVRRRLATGSIVGPVHAAARDPGLESASATGRVPAADRAREAFLDRVTRPLGIARPSRREAKKSRPRPRYTASISTKDGCIGLTHT